MLILTRKPDEEVVIKTPSGEVIKVIVVQVRGKAVRLGFAADRSVEIVRDNAVVRDRH
jgi:carbon storage regulator CsrA